MICDLCRIRDMGYISSLECSKIRLDPAQGDCFPEWFIQNYNIHVHVHRVLCISPNSNEQLFWTFINPLVDAISYSRL